MEVGDGGFTVNDYVEHGNVNLQKRSLQRYISELNREGYLKIIGKKSRSNIYATVTDSAESADWDNLFQLSEEAVQQLKKEYPEDIVQFILSNDKVVNEEVSILNQHEDVDKPNWVNFDD